MPFGGVFNGRRVLLTGHTGFKGAWLSEWLLTLGAEVTGVALEPATDPALFGQLALAERMDHRVLDIRHADGLTRVMAEVQPDFVFHLAAQPLVRLSYHRPLETYEVNVLGTIHVLEALRSLARPCVALMVTTDKCYENREWVYGYREDDPMGGHDPYSSSKAMAELAISAYRRSFFLDNSIKLASARAGNVIGGGDWARDRIVPDCARALTKGEPVLVRNKTATRPWQHVLEPLSGYLWLAASLFQPSLAKSPPHMLSSAFNFGPTQESNRSVGELVGCVLKHWPGKWEEGKRDSNTRHEAQSLRLCIDKAVTLLDWYPIWPFAVSVEQTVVWYCEAHQTPQMIQGMTRNQIELYSSHAREKGVSWVAG